MSDRKIVKVVCPKVEGNDQGFYLTYEDEMKPDDVLFQPRVRKKRVTKPKIEDKQNGEHANKPSG